MGDFPKFGHTYIGRYVMNSCYISYECLVAPKQLEFLKLAWCCNIKKHFKHISKAFLVIQGIMVYSTLNT